MALKDFEDNRASNYRSSTLLTPSEMQSLKSTRKRAQQELKELSRASKGTKQMKEYPTSQDQESIVTPASAMYNGKEIPNNPGVVQLLVFGTSIKIFNLQEPKCRCRQYNAPACLLACLEINRRALL